MNTISNPTSISLSHGLHKSIRAYICNTVLLLGAIFFSLTSWAQPSPQTNLPRASLTIDLYLIDAQIASTPRQLQTGLMWRQEMPENEGMLFVFDTPDMQCFWMKNTLLPLSAAFIADDGTIVNLVNMQPQTTDNHCSAQPVRYVLEMNQGWFEQRGIEAGKRIRGEIFQAKP